MEKKQSRSLSITTTNLQVLMYVKPLIIFLLASLHLSASNILQDTTVTGKVTSSSGESLANVSVIVKGSNAGTNTGADGSYRLSVPEGATLVFSSVGYETLEMPLNGRTEINVVLQTLAKTIDQVVVIGYGTQRRRDLTGAVTSVSGADISRLPVQTATQAIQGKVAGVQVISAGSPNANPTVRLRGTGSTLGGANPLYVVDGVFTDDIRNINSADILSMEVLKDASATAIFGMRATNGVLIITTKKGRPGKNVFSYDGTVGIREATNLIDMAGEQQYANYINEANIYYGSGDSLVPKSSLKGYNTDWYDEILQRAFYQNHNLSMSGGGERINYFLSAGLLDEEGIQVKNKYRRFTLRSNNEFAVTKKLKLITIGSYSRGEDNGPNYDAFSNAYRAAPFVPAKVGDRYGNTSLVGNVSNPVLSIDKNYTQAISNRIQGNFALEYRPIKGLTLRSAMGINLEYLKSYGYAHKFLTDSVTFIEKGGNQSQPKSVLTLTKNDASTWIWDNTATYTRTFDKHNFTILGGITSEEYNFNSAVGTADNVPANRDQWYLNMGSTGSQTIVNTGDKYTRNSYLGRLNYGYDNRYLLTASIRADGTSKFNKNNRWGYFPSIGLGWNITNESFMKNQKIFDNLKLRGSYGRVGNDNIVSSQFYDLALQNIPYYFPSGGPVFLGVAFDEFIDKNIKWEITDETDIGLDFSILKNRLSGTFDYYNKKTNNALIFIPLPGYIGDPLPSQYLTNATSISNKGVEFSLSWNDKIGKDWTYSISGNIAQNTNRIENLNGGQALPSVLTINGLAPTLTDNGSPIASYFLYDAIGIFQNEQEVAASAQPDAVPGDLIYRDISGDGKIDPEDRMFFGSYQPKWTYGFSGSVTFMNFDVGFIFYGTSGSKIYNAKKAARGANQLTDNIEADVARDRWTPNNPNTGLPRATLGSFRGSDYFLESGDFLRLNNLTVGYKIPAKIIEKVRITNFRIFFSAQNLFTVTPYTGFTPEVQTLPAIGRYENLEAGIDQNAYPSTRTFAFGVNVGF